MRSETAPARRLPWALRIVHWALIINFLVQMGYAAFMVFVVWAPEGVDGPLWEQARQVPFEHMVTRRLYALEFWVATGALAIYLALTEIAPRRRALSPRAGGG